MSLRLYRRWNPSDLAGLTRSWLSSRRRNACWTSSISATWLTVKNGRSYSSYGVEGRSTAPGSGAAVRRRRSLPVTMAMPLRSPTGSAADRRLLGGAAHNDPARLCLLGQRKGDSKDAIDVVGSNCVGVDPLGHPQPATDLTIEALLEDDSVAIAVRRAPLGADRERAVVEGHV